MTTTFLARRVRVPATRWGLIAGLLLVAPTVAQGAQAPLPLDPTVLPELVRACDRTPVGDAARERFREDAGADRTPLEAVMAIAAREPDVVEHQLDLARCYYMDNRIDRVKEALARASELMRQHAAAGTTGPPAIDALPVAGRDVPRPTKVYDAPPVYNPDAARVGLAGVVMIDAVITRGGLVQQPRLVGSIPGLDDEALRAVRQWRYEPVRVDGQPIDVMMTLMVKFGFRPSVGFTDVLDVTRHYAVRHAYLDASDWLANARNLIDTEPLDDLGAARIPEGGWPPRKTFHLAPRYPTIARTARVGGYVVLEGVITVDGTVADVKVIRSAPLLDQAAMEAVRQWRYTPLRVNGELTPLLMTTTVTFRLN